jgi:prevent-host-death family protein
MQTLDSNEARLHWRELLDRTIAGEATVITRYRKPVAVVLPFADYEDYKEAQEDAQDLRELDALEARIDAGQERVYSHAEVWAGLEDETDAADAAAARSEPGQAQDLDAYLTRRKD